MNKLKGYDAWKTTPPEEPEDARSWYQKGLVQNDEWTFEVISGSNEMVLIRDSSAYPLAVIHIDNFFDGPIYKFLDEGQSVTVQMEMAVIKVDGDEHE